MSYIFWIDAIATSKQLGNAVAAQISDEPGDAHSFDHATEVYPLGTTFVFSDRSVTASAPVAGYYVGVPCKQDTADAAGALIESGLPDGVIASVGDRAENEPQFRAWLTSNGYTIAEAG